MGFLRRGVYGLSSNRVIPLSGNYETIDGIQYFVVGKNRIKVTEHFRQEGPAISDLLEDVIKYTAKSA